MYLGLFLSIHPYPTEFRQGRNLINVNSAANNLMSEVACKPTSEFTQERNLIKLPCAVIQLYCQEGDGHDGIASKEKTIQSRGLTCPKSPT
jgi:hypothetical protein